jgi:flagellar motility protein MotE (MotC chaperone)
MSAYHSRASDQAKLDPDLKEMKYTIEQLRKELERKDARNENMTKEMQKVRASHADLQVSRVYFSCE